jgi:hypothetical protein
LPSSSERGGLLPAGNSAAWRRPESIVKGRFYVSARVVDGSEEMLEFLFHKKRDEAKRVLHGRVNRAHARSISLANARSATRGTLTEVVWVVPCSSAADADYARVFPAVCRDMCTEGIGIVHNAPITDPCVIIGLRDNTDPRFLACTLKHCTPLGYGFYHIGVIADEVVYPNAEAIDAICTALSRYDSSSEIRQGAATVR